jgi:hypothetical protein
MAPRIRSRLLAPANGDTLDQNPPTQFRWTQAANQAEDPHYYVLHIWGAGVDTLIRTNDTSLAMRPLPGYVAGERYRWHVWIKDEFTSVSSPDTFSFLYRTPTGVDERTSNLPTDFSLSQNFPNPFNPSTTIRYSIPQAGRVMLTVYDVLGREVAVLVDERREAGSHSVQLMGESLASGLYTYRLQSGGYSSSRKMIVLK